MLDAVPIPIAIADARGSVTTWNRAAAALTGITAGDAVGGELVELVVRPHERPVAREVVAAAVAGAAWQGDLIIEVAAADADGTRTARVSAFVGPLHVGAGGVILVAEDVTERRAAERRAADVARHLTLALESGRLGTWHWDISTGVTVWDAAMERLFGLEVGTFDGTFDAWVAGLHPDDVDDVLAEVQRAVDEKGSYVIEHRIVRPDGTVRWIQGRGAVTLDPDGAVTGTIGCSADITEHKTAEAEQERRREDAERLARLERAQRERLEFLASLNDAALAAESTEEMVRRVAAAAVPALGDWCALYVLSESRLEPHIEVAHADPRRVEWARELQSRYPYDPDDRTGVANVIRTGRTEFIARVEPSYVERFIDDVTRIERSELRAILDALQLTSVVTVPLTASSGVIGAMQFVSAESRRVYDHHDVALAEAAAGRVAAALEVARAADHHRSIATTLQAALLPPVLPSIDGIDLTARYWAAGSGTEVGGDFYDVFPIDDGRWAVLIGDVCGKGPAAAAVTAIARHTVRAAATHGADHSTVVEWLNDAIIGGGRERYCTVAYATLERSSASGRWQLTLVCGGHPQPRRIRDGVVDRVGEHGTLVGIFADVEVRPVTIELDPGDVVVFSTDGITDVPAPHGLSEEEFDRLLAESIGPGGAASHLADRLGDAIADRLAIRERVDDVALLVLSVDAQ